MKFLLDHDVPEEMSFSLVALGHEVIKLRNILPPTLPDREVLHEAAARHLVLITCNRDDFLALAKEQIPHAGIIVLIRRRSRALERAALVRLLDNARESGLERNVNFA